MDRHDFDFDEDERRYRREGLIWNGVLWIVALTGIAMLAWASAADARERVDNAIVFLADISGSMDQNEIQLVREAHAHAITSPEVVSAITSTGFQRSIFAYAEFSDNAVTVVGWTVVDSSGSAEAFASGILDAAVNRPVRSLTGVGAALAHAYDLLRACPCEALFKTVDIAGDGKNNTGPDPSIARALLLNDGVTINGLPMTLSPARDDAAIATYYANEIVGGARSFSFPLTNITELPVLLRRKLILELF